MPGVLLTRKDIGTAAVIPQRRKFDSVTGQVREARVFFSFSTADVGVSMPHSLGRAPTSFRVVRLSRDGVPGVVYAPIQNGGGTNATTDASFNFTKNYIVLACSTANTWAEVVIS